MKKKKDLEGIKILILIIVVVSILLIFVKGYENKKMENVCLTLEQNLKEDPDFLYQCECFPKVNTSDISMEILNKIKPLCTCRCDIDGKKMGFDIAMSK